MKNSYKPSTIDKDSNIKELIAKKSNIIIIDAFSRQLKELFFIKI